MGQAARHSGSAGKRVTIAAIGVALALTAAGSAASGASQTPSIAPGDPWIAYSSHDGIHLARPDGSDDLILDVGAGSTHPDWSPDGSRLAYVKDSTEIWSANADGTGQSRVVACDAGCDFLDNPAWSPDGTQMAYVRFASAEGRFTGSTIEVIDLETGSHRSVAEGTAPEFLVGPRWSPDGGSLVVEIDRYPDEPLLVDHGYPVVGNAIAVVDISGPGPGTLRRLTDWALFATYPDWHPSEDLIVFSTYDLSSFQQTDEPSNLYAIRPDGTEVTQLTTFGPAGTRATQPSWTPDGERIIFTQVGQEPGDFDQPRQVAFIERDGAALTVLDRIDRTHARLRPTP